MNWTPGLPSYSRMLSGADLWDHGHEINGRQNHTVGKNESQSQSRCHTRGVRAVLCQWPRTLCVDGSQGPSWSPSKWTLSPDGCSESPHVLRMSCQKEADASAAVEWWSGQGGACPLLRWGPGRLGLEGERGRDPQRGITSFVSPRLNHGRHQQDHTPRKPTVNSLPVERTFLQAPGLHRSVRTSLCSGSGLILTPV